MILFSANPATYNRSGKVIPQLKDRIGSLIQTHYPHERDTGIQIMEQECGLSLDGDFPIVVPFFMKQIIEEISRAARKSRYIDQQSGVSARFSLANYQTMIASIDVADVCWAKSLPYRESVISGICIRLRSANWKLI